MAVPCSGENKAGCIEAVIESLIDIKSSGGDLPGRWELTGDTVAEAEADCPFYVNLGNYTAYTASGDKYMGIFGPWSYDPIEDNQAQEPTCSNTNAWNNLRRWKTVNNIFPECSLTNNTAYMIAVENVRPYSGDTCHNVWFTSFPSQWKYYRHYEYNFDVYLFLACTDNDILFPPVDPDFTYEPEIGSIAEADTVGMAALQAYCAANGGEMEVATVECLDYYRCKTRDDWTYTPDGWVPDYCIGIEGPIAAIEGDTATYRIYTLSQQPLLRDITVFISYVGSTARMNDDFIPVNSVIFPEGETEVFFDIQILTDNFVWLEGEESLNITISIDETDTERVCEDNVLTTITDKPLPVDEDGNRIFTAECCAYFDRKFTEWASCTNFDDAEYPGNMLKDGTILE